MAGTNLPPLPVGYFWCQTNASGVWHAQHVSASVTLCWLRDAYWTQARWPEGAPKFCPRCCVSLRAAGWPLEVIEEY